MTARGSETFYWQTARDSLLTPKALSMFLLALRHDGEDFDQAKTAIDVEYEAVTGRDASQRHGGNFATFIRVFEEAGWMYVDNDQGRPILRATRAGRQAELLFSRLPDMLKAVPYFLTELLSRYQLNNPAGPEDARNIAIEQATKHSNVFPYWTIWKIMRSCDNMITTDELRRFVFRLQRSEDIDSTIAQIKQFRRDVNARKSQEELDSIYPPALEGAVGEPKYIMGRAGRHFGKLAKLIEKPNGSTYRLNSVYYSFIDEVLANEPVFREQLDANTWFHDYGAPILLDEEYVPESLLVEDDDARLDYEDIEPDDPTFKKVESLLRIGARNILFVGPPGTSKTTYALRIGAKLAEGRPNRFHNVQFHQSFGYEDFLVGYVPSDDPKEGSAFVLKRKVFLRACEAARQDASGAWHVLVIDEINRGDPSRIFGEALTYVERRNENFELPYRGWRAVVPRNLVILATMNPLDKSIADLDMAMDRRFERIEMPPSEQILRRILVGNNAEQAFTDKVATLFKNINTAVGARIGHAYFKDARDNESMRMVWEHKLLPLLDRDLRHQQEALQQLKHEVAVAFRDNEIQA